MTQKQSETKDVRPMQAKRDGNSSLSPEGKIVQQALVEGAKIVSDSAVGQFLLRQDALEAYSEMVVAAQRCLLSSRGM